MNINRVGIENLVEIDKRLDFNEKLVLKALKKITIEHLDWSSFEGLLKKTDIYRRAGELRSVKNLDEVATAVMISQLHPKKKVREHFWKKAEFKDKLQACAVLYARYNIVSNDFIAIFREEVERIAEKLGVEQFLPELVEWNDAFWTIEKQKELLVGLLGILGLRNEDSRKIRWPKSRRWREQVLVGWLFRRLIEADQVLGESHRFLLLAEYDSVYALTFKYIVSGHKKYFQMAKASKQEDELQVYLLLYRFGDFSRVNINWCAHALSQFLDERHPGLDSDIRNDIQSEGLWGNEFQLLAPVGVNPPIKYIATVIQNEINSKYRKLREHEGEHTVLEDVEYCIPSKHERPMRLAVKNENSSFIRDVMGEIGSVRCRMALALRYSISPKKEWYDELAEALDSKVEYVQEKFEYLLSPLDFSLVDEVVASLFKIQFKNIERYALRGEADFQKLLTQKFEDEQGSPEEKRCLLDILSDLSLRKDNHNPSE